MKTHANCVSAAATNKRELRAMRLNTLDSDAAAVILYYNN
jgi:hypothetical protein